MFFFSGLRLIFKTFFSPLLGIPEQPLNIHDISNLTKLKKQGCTKTIPENLVVALNSECDLVGPSECQCKCSFENGVSTAGQSNCPVETDGGFERVELLFFFNANILYLCSSKKLILKFKKLS